MKRLLKKSARKYFGALATFFAKEALLRNRPSTKAAQLLLSLQYRMIASTPGGHLPRIGEVGFREFSEFEEDGILLYLFSLIHPQAKTCVEICAGNGIECNTANLIINHGWWGHLFDGNQDNVDTGKAF